MKEGSFRHGDIIGGGDDTDAEGAHRLFGQREIVADDAVQKLVAGIGLCQRGHQRLLVS